MHLTPTLKALGLAGCMAPLAVLAEELPAPEGDVILTVTGAIANTNDGEAENFDRAMLEALENRTFETSTIWTDGTHAYTGVPISVLMETVGATGSGIAATAINDYSVDIPASDFADDGPILAHLMDGQPMSVRNKGPLWVIYPFDENPEYRAEVIYSRSIWQVERITVQE